MNKKTLGIILAVAIAAVGVILFATMRRGPDGPGGADISDALAGFDQNSEYVYVKAAHPSNIRTIVSGVKNFAELLASDEFQRSVEQSDGLPFDEYDIRRFVRSDNYSMLAKVLATIDMIVGSSDQLSFFITRERGLAAMLTTDDKFAEMKQTLEREFGQFAARESSIEGESFAFGPGGFFVVHKLSAQGRPTLVLAGTASDEEGIKNAVAAWKDGTGRAKLDRKLTDPDVMKFRVQATSPMGGAQTMSTELTWKSSSKETVVTTHSVADPGAKKTSGLEKSPLPLYGTTPPTALFSIDVPFFFSLLAPGSDTPIRDVLTFGATISGNRSMLDEQALSIAESLLGSARITLSASLGDSIMPRNAYAVIEMTNTGEADELFGLSQMFGTKTTAKGWDEAYTAELGPGMDIFVARSKTQIIAGLGGKEEYETAATMPADMASLPKSPILSATHVDIAQITDPKSELGSMIRGYPGSDVIFKVLDALGLGSIKSISSVQSATTDASGIIAWK